MSIQDNGSEDRYEAVEMILKVRKDGISWFDFFFDLITEECEGDPESDDASTCTCGMETMGGSSGTLDQCYRSQGIANDLVVGPINKADLEKVLDFVKACGRTVPKTVADIATKLRKECTWWDDVKDSFDDEEEENGEEG